MKYLISALVVLILAFNLPAIAQEGDSAIDKRIELAEKMHELRPTRDQVYTAIDQFAQSRPEAERDGFKAAMRNAFNVKTLEKISINAYAETYTVEELEAMVEYYSKPAAISAAAKSEDYASIVYPEIIRMLDRAAMRVRTGK